jgi:predicted nucleotidyltransferase
MNDPVLEKAKRIITEHLRQAGLQVCRIVLFGSRARGDSHPASDDLASAVCWSLAQEEIFADIFIQSQRLAAERAHDPGYLTYYALQEGTDL